MQITTRVFGGNSPAVVLEGEEEHSHFRFYKSSRKIAYLPSASMTYSLWFKRRWMAITRTQQLMYVLYTKLPSISSDQMSTLMEDIDAAFTHGVSRSDTSESDDEKDPRKSDKRSPGSASTSTAPSNKLSLSGLLNALDGVGAQEGRILFATTNRYSALDRALCRPGRMDVLIEFKNASKYQAKELFNRFYVPNDVEDQDMHESGEFPNGLNTCSEKSTPEGNTIVTPIRELSLFTHGSHARHAPSLSAVRVAELSERFADAIPDHQCSMASLQGYLMTYKTRPVEAVERVIEWVEKEQKERQEQEEAPLKKEWKVKETEKEEDKEEEPNPASTGSMDVSTSFLPCTCRKVPDCPTCGGVQFAVVLPFTISKPVSPSKDINTILDTQTK
ncbi:hypothetical protein C0993_009184 [Termitomyces sp. T159_Od127]|nr:hypothetical protein C0993_009184 [Termitomyces sp. T159_Od127]